MKIRVEYTVYVSPEFRRMLGWYYFGRTAVTPPATRDVIARHYRIHGETMDAAIKNKYIAWRERMDENGNG